MFKQKSQKHPNLKNIQKHKEIPKTHTNAYKHANNNTETKLPNSLLLILQKNRDIQAPGFERFSFSGKKKIKMRK